MVVEGKTLDPTEGVSFYFVPKEQLTYKDSVYMAGMKYTALKSNIVLISQVQRWFTANKVDIKEL